MSTTKPAPIVTATSARERPDHKALRAANKVHRVYGGTLRIMLFCSFRYALERKSYMPAYIRDIIKEHIAVLNKADLRELILEIEQFKEANKKLIAPSVIAEWALFSNWLNSQLHKEG